MNGNTEVDYRDPKVIRQMGIVALTKGLEPVGMAYLIQQYDRFQKQTRQGVVVL
jgi:hypothetical protein